jgi:hypothetical protein
MPSDLEIPKYGGLASDLHGWLLEAVQEGENWLKQQRPATEWTEVLKVLGPQYNGKNATPLGDSRTGYNLVRYNYAQIRATLSNFKHVGEYLTTEEDSKEQFDRAHLLTNLDRHWERTTFASRQIRKALGYALAKGTGYLYEDWDKSRWVNRGDIRLRAFDPADITFVQLPPSHDIQQAYVTIIREELPLQLARRMYADNPAFARALTADQDAPSSSLIQKGYERVAQFISPMLNTSGAVKKQNQSYPTVFIYHAYTMDGSINDHPEAMTMGAAGTNWSYRVPHLGEPLAQAIVNPRTGEPYTLPATPSDCLLFPLRRLTIFSRTGTAYDGSSPWWHGETPVARITFNDLPWEALGASQIGDAITMQDGIIETMRAVEDSVAARLDPPAIYDDGLDKSVGDAFNPRKAGARMQYDLTNGVPIQYPVPPDTYNVPSWILGEGGYIRGQEDRIDKVTSVRDLVAVAKARQIPSSDTLEKLMEMAGPIVQDMVQALVEPLTQLGEWRKAYYFQFYTKHRMIQIADPSGVEILSSVKYEPDKLIPKQVQTTPNPMSETVRSFLSDFRYDVTESGLSEFNRMTQTLLFVQLSKAGFPISWWSIAKSARIPNFGPPPEGTNTELERWTAQQRMQAELQADIQVEAAQAMAAAGIGGPPAGPGGEAPPNGNGDGAGRPPSFKKPPHIVNKPNEGRSTVSTS